MVGTRQDTWVVYLMAAWEGGSDWWIRSLKENNEIYDVYHSSRDRNDAWNPNAHITYKGIGDWDRLAVGAAPQAKAKAKAKAKTKAKAKPKAKAKADAEARCENLQPTKKRKVA